MTEARSVRSKSEDPATPSSSKISLETKSAFLNEHSLAWERMNERAVEDQTLKFFYKPHTITALFGSIFAAMYFAFIRQVASIDFFIDFLQDHHDFLLHNFGVFLSLSQALPTQRVLPTIIVRLCFTDNMKS